MNTTFDSHSNWYDLMQLSKHSFYVTIVAMQLMKVTIFILFFALHRRERKKNYFVDCVVRVCFLFCLAVFVHSDISHSVTVRLVSLCSMRSIRIPMKQFTLTKWQTTWKKNKPFHYLDIFWMISNRVAFECGRFAVKTAGKYDLEGVR